VIKVNILPSVKSIVVLWWNDVIMVLGCISAHGKDEIIYIPYCGTAHMYVSNNVLS